MNRIAKRERKGFEEGENLTDSVGLRIQINSYYLIVLEFGKHATRFAHTILLFYTSDLSCVHSLRSPHKCFAFS